MILTSDQTNTLGGVTVNTYLLTTHNPNGIAMPDVRMPKPIGVTVHNTDWIKTAAGTTPAEQYTRATVNGNMKDVRVHYYVDNTCAWQNLPLDRSGWHAADGGGDGNRKTIAIECIMSKHYNEADKTSEDNCARLAAALLNRYGLGIDCLFTHTHWLNVRDGKKGTIDELNTMHHSYKMCPAYILPHWDDFKAKVQQYLTASDDAPKPTLPTETPVAAEKKPVYRVRKSWKDAKSQTGAFTVLDNAKKACGTGFSVFDESGHVVFPSSCAFCKGQRITIQSAPLYASESAKKPVRNLSGSFYLYDGKPCANGRYRITTTLSNCGNTPIGKYVTGYVSAGDFQ